MDSWQDKIDQWQREFLPLSRPVPRWDWRDTVGEGNGAFAIRLPDGNVARVPRRLLYNADRPINEMMLQRLGTFTPSPYHFENIIRGSGEVAEVLPQASKIDPGSYARRVALRDEISRWIKIQGYQPHDLNPDNYMRIGDRILVTDPQDMYYWPHVGGPTPQRPMLEALAARTKTFAQPLVSNSLAETVARRASQPGWPSNVVRGLKIGENPYLWSIPAAAALVAFLMSRGGSGQPGQETPA